jgi:CBS domain-containing protein
MKVYDLVQSRQEVFSVTEDVTVHDLARYLRQKQLRAVGVQSSDGRLVGLVSQSDLSEKVTAENKCPAWMRVSEIMSRELITVTPETPLDECLSLMEQHGFFHLPVVDAKIGYRGLVSAKDLLKVIASDHKARADMLESFIFQDH